MDAVDVEHLFADALGIGRGKRGDVNDADAIRVVRARNLVKALDKALTRLKKRAESLSESDKMKFWIERSIADLGMVQDSIDKAQAKVDDHPACFQLWCLSAVSLSLIDKYLRQRNC
jgi:hypothetical protein